MINFIKKFITSLSDAELEHLRTKVWDETNLRDAAKRAQFGSDLPELNDAEKALAPTSKIEAIKAYRIRTGQYLKSAKDAVEDYLNLPK